MCASCGCLRGEDDHGESGHITLSQLHQAAVAAGIAVDEVVNNIRDTFELAAVLEGHQPPRKAPLLPMQANGLR